MELKHHEGILSRRDSFVIDPRLLKVDAGYNVRDLTTPETREHIDALKESIGINSVRVPLEVRLAGADIYIVAGHCRYVAVMELIAEGRDDIKGIPCVPEPKNTNDGERTLNLAISNSGKPLTTIEVAEVVRRLQAFGWTEDKIQKRMRWKSRATVTQHVEVAALPETMKQHVRDGEISATLARNIVKGADPEVAEKLIRENLEENKRLGVGKRTKNKVTQKTINRNKPKPVPSVAGRSGPAQLIEGTNDATQVPPVADPLPSTLSRIPEDRIAPHDCGAGSMAPELGTPQGLAAEQVTALAQATSNLVNEVREVMRAIEAENPNCMFGNLPECIRAAERVLSQYGDVISEPLEVNAGEAV